MKNRYKVLCAQGFVASCAGSTAKADCSAAAPKSNGDAAQRERQRQGTSNTVLIRGATLHSVVAAVYVLRDGLTLHLLASSCNHTHAMTHTGWAP